MNYFSSKRHWLFTSKHRASFWKTNLQTVYINRLILVQKVRKTKFFATCVYFILLWTIQDLRVVPGNKGWRRRGLWKQLSSLQGARVHPLPQHSWSESSGWPQHTTEYNHFNIHFQIAPMNELQYFISNSLALTLSFLYYSYKWRKA